MFTVLMYQICSVRGCTFVGVTSLEARLFSLSINHDKSSSVPFAIQGTLGGKAWCNACFAVPLSQQAGLSILCRAPRLMPPLRPDSPSEVGLHPTVMHLYAFF